MSLKEKCAGELELHKPGMLGALLPWRRFFFQLAETEGGSRLYQYGSSRDQADGKAAPSSLSTCVHPCRTNAMPQRHHAPTGMHLQLSQLRP